MRDWLTVIIILLIAGIVLDAIRRMRNARMENIQLSKNAVKADSEIKNAKQGNREFPMGSARVVRQRDDQDAQKITQSLKENFKSSKTTIGAPQRIPEQVTLNLEEAVPMLMESVTEEVEQVEEEVEAHNEPSIGSLDDIGESSEAEKILESSSTEGLGDEFEGEPSLNDVPDEVLIFNIMARQGEHFSGDALMEALMAQYMKFGAMDIFHRHTDESGEGVVLFSMANMVVPGTFNLATMSSFSTPGVSLFMSLPISGIEEGDSIGAYEVLVRTAKSLAELLGGELKDENRSVMTQQTIEHGRQRVVEFERKRRLAEAY